MPPKEQFDRKKIVDTAIEIVDAEGIFSISARKIAKELGCSTAPIYRIFRSMDKLESAVVDRIIEILIEYTWRDYTEHRLLNIGIGIISFARNHKAFYRTLFVDNDKYHPIVDKYYSDLKEQMKKAGISRYFSDEELVTILEKLSTFTHGLATLICSGMIKEDEASHEELVEFLRETGADIMGATLYRKHGGDGEVLKEFLGSRK